jgi:hypothetical protein
MVPFLSLLSVTAGSSIAVCTAFSVLERNTHYRGSLGFDTSNTILRRNNNNNNFLVSTPTTKTVLQSSSASISSNEDLLPGISVIDGANDVISQQMENLQESPYFRLFCVDILASCEYMPQELFECYSETCEVYPVDDEEVCIMALPFNFQKQRFIPIDRNTLTVI